MRPMTLPKRKIEVLPERDPADFTPFRGLCLVRLDHVPEQTESGIHLLTEYGGRKAVVRGSLVALGVGAPDDVKDIPLESPIVMHGHSRASYRFTWSGKIYGVYVAEDLMAVEVVA